jgi:ABC-type glycerol-3-phosphate transport system permease component
MKNQFGVAGRVGIVETMSLLSALMLLPLLWLLSVSLQRSGDVFAVPPPVLPSDPTLDHYAYVWSAGGVQGFFLNSVIVAVGTVVANVGCATLAGFALARLRFRGRQVAFSAILATMLVPFPSIMLSLFVVAKNLGLYGSLAGVVAPLAEAAYLDGCSPLRTFVHVMLPLVKAPLATSSILVFTLTWSEFLWPLLILRLPEDFTITIGLQYFMSALTGNWHNIAAVAILASAPTVAVFLLLQRYFFSGHLTGATKG